MIFLWGARLQDFSSMIKRTCFFDFKNMDFFFSFLICSLAEQRLGIKEKGTLLYGYSIAKWENEGDTKTY